MNKIVIAYSDSPLIRATTLCPAGEMIKRSLLCGVVTQCGATVNSTKGVHIDDMNIEYTLL